VICAAIGTVTQREIGRHAQRVLLMCWVARAEKLVLLFSSRKDAGTSRHRQQASHDKQRHAEVADSVIALADTFVRPLCTLLLPR
jgi:hypothetical protein